VSTTSVDFKTSYLFFLSLLKSF